MARPPDQRRHRPGPPPNLKTILPEKAARIRLPSSAGSPNPPPAKPPSSRSSSARWCWKTPRSISPTSPSSPPGAFDVQELGGTVKGLSSQEQSTATVDLRGKVDAASPFAISGKVNPLAKDLQLDLAVAFTNTDLTAFTTYLEKYAGHPLNKGKLYDGAALRHQPEAAQGGEQVPD